MARRQTGALLFLFALVFPMAPAAGEEEFYLRLAERYAPVIWQDTGYLPEADYLTAFDGDRDWVGRNNLDNLKAGAFKPYLPYVYYLVLETKTHYFLIYEFFHPFDYDRPWMKWIPGTFHENDTEGVMVVVKKEAGEPFGRFRFMETKPHGYTRDYADDPEVKKARGGRVERVRLRGGSHPEIYIQAGGHGPYALAARGGGLLPRGGFHKDTGVVYSYAGRPQPPESPNDRNAGYALISVFGERGFWTHRCDPETFDRYRPYKPPPGRPGIPEELLCENGAIPWNLDGDLSGEANEEDAAGAPWSHFGIDPAFHAARKWRVPEPFSAEYVFNPFLGIDLRQARSR